MVSMPDDHRMDPFKPRQPSIPGIEDVTARKTPADTAPAAAGSPTRANAPQHLTWIVAGVLALGIGAGAFLWQRGSSSQADRPVAEPTPAAAPVAAQPVKPVPNWPVGPGPVATVEELAKPWAGKRFLFPDPVTSEPIPAMIVHLPDGSYWAFSLREPFGTCDLDYVTDLEKLRTGYNFRASHPMVVDTCNRTVYDLLRYGGSSDGGLVRGDVVEGSGIRPPIAIEVRVEGKHLIAVRTE